MANVKKFSRRSIALFWLVAVAVFIGAMIYFEQIALLYVAATLALVVLLMVVSFADLKEVGGDESASPSKK